MGRICLSFSASRKPIILIKSPTHLEEMQLQMFKEPPPCLIVVCRHTLLYQSPVFCCSQLFQILTHQSSGPAAIFLHSSSYVFLACLSIFVFFPRQKYLFLAATLTCFSYLVRTVSSPTTCFTWNGMEKLHVSLLQKEARSALSETLSTRTEHWIQMSAFNFLRSLYSFKELVDLSMIV